MHSRDVCGVACSGALILYFRNELAGDGYAWMGNMSEVVWVVSCLEFVLNRYGDLSTEFLGVLMPNMNGVLGKELYGYDVSLCRKTSSDETILGSDVPLFGLNCKYKIQN